MSSDQTPTSPPSGTRDFVGEELRRRERAVGRIARVFERYGFDPLQTPAFERIELLTGKYGEDEKLIFKIAGRGAKEQAGPDLALRYDMTVPLARFAAARGELTARGLRSYRIGPVWRADRPARGRFREFLQCDIDVVGSTSPVADADVQLAVASALAELGITDFAIHLNSRRVLAGLAEAYGVPEDAGKAFSVAIDKLAKIGVDGVADELRARGVDATAVARLEEDLRADDAADAVAKRLDDSELGAAGLDEVRQVQRLVSAGLPAGRVEFDPFIARGLDYYTGPVFEFFGTGPDSLGLSIAAGGRYDELVGSLSGRPTPACGGSLGFERLMLMLDADESTSTGTQALVTVWSDERAPEMVAIAGRLREHGVRTEVSLSAGSLGAQLRYAAGRGATVAVIRGPSEQAEDTVTVRDLASGAQHTAPREDVVRTVLAVLDGTG